MNNITTRIQKIMEELNLSTSQLERDLDVGNGTIQKALKRESNFNSDLLEKIVRRYAINPTFILTGTGDIRIKPPAFMQHEATLQVVNEPEGDAMEVNISDKVVMQVPLVNQYAYAGYWTGFADPEYVNELPKIPWLVDKEHRGNYISFEVKNDSMFDGSVSSYEEGDIVLAREIDRTLWKSKLHYKRWDFILVHRSEGVILKSIVAHDVDKGRITVHSLNPEYPDREIMLGDLVKLFNVVRVMRKMEKRG